MKKKQQFLVFATVFMLLALTSCNKIGLMSDKNSWLPNEINSFGDFLGVYAVLQISMLVISLLLGIFLGAGGYPISLLLHFIWIVGYRDYGFLLVLLLFGVLSGSLFLIDKIKKLF